jgi:sirohydrochlorin cobaltochelatase
LLLKSENFTAKLLFMSKAILLIGHGSLKQASGASMIRLAALLRKHGVVPVATAAFLNFSKPTFADGLERCIKKGATEIYVQPYFLIDGYYVTTTLKTLVEEAQRDYPDIAITMGEPFGSHRVLVEIVSKRIKEAVPHFATHTAVVLMAHGTPTPQANAPIYTIGRQLEVSLTVPVHVAFMECNEPTISEAIDSFASEGFESIINVPYFLHLGSHVREDLPAITQAAQERHLDKTILLTEHLGYDESFLDIIQDKANKVSQRSMQ